MMLGHFAASAGSALDLPAWALAYVVFAVSVIVILVSRNRTVPRARPRTADDEVALGVDASTDRPGRGVRVAQVVSALVFWTLVVFCWLGPSVLTQNIATLGIVGMFWSLGGWVALVFGWCWEALDPFAVFARTRPRATTTPMPTPWWAPIPVFASYVIVWVAWIAGDEPRHFAVWLTLYGCGMVVVARRGGTAALEAWNALPAALDLTAPVTRPGRARVRARDRAVRIRVALIAAMLLGAIGANEVAATKWFITSVADDGGLGETVWIMVIFAILSAAIFAVWRAGERFVERARGETDTRPLAAALGPMAGGVLLAQAVMIGITQTQNVLVLISDPFARGWDLFGTVYWQVSNEPLSPLTRGLVQAGAILAGHLTALMMVGTAATARAADGTTSPRARNRAWTASLGTMTLVVVSGVVWTLVLLR